MSINGDGCGVRALGIDPGVVRLGYALIDKGQDGDFALLESGVVALPQKPDEKFGDYRRRVSMYWWDEFPQMYARLLPDTIASETLPAKGSGNFINPATEAIKAAITVMQISAYSAGCPPWTEIASSTVKKAVVGMASKPPKPGSKKRVKVSKVDMRNAVQRVFPELKDRVWEKDLMADEIDAIGIALTALGYKAPKMNKIASPHV